MRWQSKILFLMLFFPMILVGILFSFLSMNELAENEKAKRQSVQEQIEEEEELNDPTLWPEERKRLKEKRNSHSVVIIPYLSRAQTGKWRSSTAGASRSRMERPCSASRASGWVSASSARPNSVRQAARLRSPPGRESQKRPSSQARALS